ncbi:MAG: calcium-binding protein [Pseudomonadota bacterium]
MAKVQIKNWVDPKEFDAQPVGIRFRGFNTEVMSSDLVRVSSGNLTINFDGRFSFDKDGRLKSSAVEKVTFGVDDKTFAEVTEIDPLVFMDEAPQTYEPGDETVVIDRFAKDGFVTVTNTATGDVTTIEISDDATYGLAQSQTENLPELPDIMDSLYEFIGGENPFDFIRQLLNGSDEIRGSLESDELSGGLGDDFIRGAHGNDLLYGNDGNDVLKGGFGRDTLKGGGGDDRIWGGADGDKLIGMSGQDTLYGGADNDKLHGKRGNDELRGGEGDDLLIGGAGKDKLHGGSGDDRIVGGTEADKLTGGAGSDIFILSEGDGRDVITDFLKGADVLDVSDFGFDDAAEVLALAKDNGERTVIDLSETSQIVLRNTVLDDLDETHFIV